MSEARSYSRPVRRNEANWSVIIEELNLDSLANCFEDKEIWKLDKQNETGANIIGLRKSDRSYIINPGRDVILSCADQLFVLGTVDQIGRLKELLVTDVTLTGS